MTIDEEVGALTDRLEVQLLRAKTGELDADRLYTLAAGLLDTARRIGDPHQVQMVRSVEQKVAQLAAVAVAKRSGGVAFKDQEVGFKIMEATR